MDQFTARFAKTKIRGEALTCPPFGLKNDRTLAPYSDISSRELSVDPSSMTIISLFAYLIAKALSMQSRKKWA